MTGSWDVDSAFCEFSQHRQTIQAAGGSNEATTRLRAIDTVVFDVLGWSKVDVELEKYARDVGYVDYAFLEGSGCPLILEAKRSGKTLVLPVAKYSADPVTFALIGHECPEALDAMRQATNYAASLGASYAAISNGYQWILSLAFVPGRRFEERLVYVFESMDAISARFRSFWSCFSPEAIRERIPTDSLLESRKAPAPAKASLSIPGYPNEADRNIVVNELSLVLTGVWDTMGREEVTERFLRRCYVHPSDSLDTLALAQDLLRERRKRDEELSGAGLVASEKIGTFADGPTPDKPIVLLGGIGHGKSTFLRYLRLVRAPAEFERYIQIDIDFVDRPDGPSEVSRYIHQQIEDQLRKRYAIDTTRNEFVRGVLNLQLKRFRDTPEGVLYSDDPKAYQQAEVRHIQEIRGDPYSFLTLVFRHLRSGRRQSVAIFFDNLDRQPDAIQEEAFKKASSMARDWGSLVFVCLRPTTFFASRRRGLLDALAPQVIVVPPPDVRALLRTRFQYAADAVRGDGGGARIGHRASGAPGSRSISLLSQGSWTAATTRSTGTLAWSGSSKLWPMATCASSSVLCGRSLRAST